MQYDGTPQQFVADLVMSVIDIRWYAPIYAHCQIGWRLVAGYAAALMHGEICLHGLYIFVSRPPIPLDTVPLGGGCGLVLRRYRSARLRLPLA